jgi:predicted DNA-binding transcriptional regulator AlpA
MLKVADVAEMLGVSTSCIYKKAKEIGGVKIGTALRFDPDSIQYYINKRRMVDPAESNRETIASSWPPPISFDEARELIMTGPYIQSVTISLPAEMICGDAKYLNYLFKSNNWGTYLKYGYTSLILINTTPFGYDYSMWSTIESFFTLLQRQGILSRFLVMDQLRIHEIKLRFDIAIPGSIFCKTGGFLKVNNNTYRSNDTRKFKRRARTPQEYESYSEMESKGRQQSFVTVIQYGEGSSVIFSFSGKYRKHISFDYLSLPKDDLIQRLCLFAGVYLTHATNPGNFKVAPGYVPMFPKEFQFILKEANWFSGCFRKKI